MKNDRKQYKYNRKSCKNTGAFKVALWILFMLTMCTNVAFASPGTIRFITIGDVHMTNSVNTDEYKSLVQAVDYINNRTDVDFVVELGDIVDKGTDQNFVEAKSILSRLNKPYYAVEGNHDDDLGGENFIKYFGPTEHIENINGYQLIFAGIKGGGTIHWSFNYSNVDKSVPTVIFNHGPVQPDVGIATCEKSWRDALHRYSCDMKSEVNSFTDLLGYYSGHIHGETQQTINGTLYVTARVLTVNDRIGYTVIQNGVVNYTVVTTSIPWVSTPGPTETPTPWPTETLPPGPTSTVPPNNGGGGGDGGNSGNGNSGNSGGGGGGGLGTAEPYENMYKYEIKDRAVSPIPVSFQYETPELAIYDVLVTSNQSDVTSLRIEVLKDTSKLVGKVASGIVYKNLNFWMDYKRIRNATIRYKVENSWMVDNGLSGNNIKMSRWDNSSGEWIELLTVVSNKDDKYMYFESQTDSLSSPFVINGIKSDIKGEYSSGNNEQFGNIAHVDIEKVVTDNASKSGNIEKQQAPGFEIILSIVSVISVIIFMRRK